MRSELLNSKLPEEAIALIRRFDSHALADLIHQLDLSNCVSIEGMFSYHDQATWTQNASKSNLEGTEGIQTEEFEDGMSDESFQEHLRRAGWRRAPEERCLELLAAHAYGQ